MLTQDATLTLVSALYQRFGVQLYKNNASALLSRILNILNLDWLQHAHHVRGVYELNFKKMLWEHPILFKINFFSEKRWIIAPKFCSLDAFKNNWKGPWSISQCFTTSKNDVIELHHSFDPCMHCLVFLIVLRLAKVKLKHIDCPIIFLKRSWPTYPTYSEIQLEDNNNLFWPNSATAVTYLTHRMWTVLTCWLTAMSAESSYLKIKI